MWEVTETDRKFSFCSAFQNFTSKHSTNKNCRTKIKEFQERIKYVTTIFVTTDLEFRENALKCQDVSKNNSMQNENSKEIVHKDFGT